MSQLTVVQDPPIAIAGLVADIQNRTIQSFISAEEGPDATGATQPSTNDETYDLTADDTLVVTTVIDGVTLVSTLLVEVGDVVDIDAVTIAELIALVATVMIGIIAPFVSWLGARNFSPNFLTYLIGRGIIVFSRSVHELIWALFFVIAVGLGPLPGILALSMRGIGFVSKVVAEEVETMDMKPVEAIRATGASTLKVSA